MAIVAADVLSVVACSQIGRTKGRLGFGMLGLLLGPLGVAITASIKPAAGGGPERDDFSRLAWLRRDGIKPWTQRGDWLAVTGALVALVVAIVALMRGPAGTLDGAAVASDIQSQMELRLASVGISAPSLTVDCPDAPMQAGKIFDCTLIGLPAGTGYTHVRVTEDDDQGRYHYEPW